LVKVILVASSEAEAQEMADKPIEINASATKGLNIFNRFTFIKYLTFFA
jgi:hypothetical protein